MLRRAKDGNQNVLTGILFIIAGAVWVYAGWDYSLGTLTRAGPGFFPLLLAAALILTGAVTAIVPSANSQAVRFVGGREAATILVGTASFVFIDQLGLVLASFLVVFLSGVGSKEWKLVPLAAYAAGMALFSVLVFQKGLGMTLPVWPPQLGLH